MNRRLTPALTGFAVAGVFSLFVMGSAFYSLALSVPVFAIAGVVALARRRPATVDRGWTPPPAVAPVLAAGGSSGQVTAALARVESRELALSGVAFS